MADKYERRPNVQWTCSPQDTGRFSHEAVSNQLLCDIRDALLDRNSITREQTRVLSRIDRRLALSGLKLSRGRVKK